MHFQRTLHWKCALRGSSMFHWTGLLTGESSETWRPLHVALSCSPIPPPFLLHLLTSLLPSNIDFAFLTFCRKPSLLLALLSDWLKTWGPQLPLSQPKRGVSTSHLSSVPIRHPRVSSALIGWSTEEFIQKIRVKT